MKAVILPRGDLTNRKNIALIFMFREEFEI